LRCDIMEECSINIVLLFPVRSLFVFDAGCLIWCKLRPEAEPYNIACDRFDLDGAAIELRSASILSVLHMMCECFLCKNEKGGFRLILP